MHVLGEVLEVEHHVVVADQAEVQVPVVAQDRHAKSLVAGQRDHREAVDQLPSQQVEGVLRPRDVGDHHVEVPPTGERARRLAHDRCRREAAHLADHLGTHRAALLLEVLQLLVHELEAVDRVLAPDRQGGVDGLHAGAGLLVLDAQRDQALELDVVGADPPAAQVAAQRPGHDGHHHVVDRATQPVLDRLEVLQRGAHPGEPPMGADRAVVGARRGGPDPCPGQRPGGHGAVSHPGSDPARGPQDCPGGARHLPRRGALDQRLAEQLRRGGEGARQPAPARVGGGRGVGRAVEQNRHQVHAGDPVHQRVVGLGQQDEAAVLQALGQPQLPQRLVAVQRLREDPPCQGAQLLLGARRGQRGRAHVVLEVEVRVVDPLRAPLPQRDGRQPLAVAGDQVQPPLDLGHQLLVAGRVALEQHHRGHVHVSRRVLEVEEGRIQSAQAVVGHCDEAHIRRLDSG